MKIGWVSVSIHARTGYGRMTEEICSRLIDKYDVVTIGQESDSLVWGVTRPYVTQDGRSIPTLNITDPVKNRGAVADLTRAYCKKYDIDYLIGLWDVWVLQFLGDITVPHALYIPIDAALTEKWAGYMERAHKVIAYSRFGYEAASRSFDPSLVSYVPHGVDTGVFKPMPGADKEALRAQLPGKTPIPKDAFLFVCTQANIGERKNMPLLLRTFKKFVDSHPDAHIYLHTNAAGDAPHSYDLEQLSRQLGIEANVHFPISSPILLPASDEELCRLYNASDVYISNSAAEGFGLPLLEAAACGVPAIAPDNSAQSELVKGHGWLVKNVDPEEYSDFPVYVPTLQQNSEPNQRDLLNKMEQAYYEAEKRAEYGALSRRFAVENYDWKVVMQQWFRVLDDIEQEVSMFTEVRSKL